MPSSVGNDRAPLPHGRCYRLMPAYVISLVESFDPQRVREYASLAEETIARYGGRYVVRTDKLEVVEGASAPRLFIVVEFPSLERAREWYASPEYAPALAIRETVLRRTLLFADGALGYGEMEPG